jgi:hypothetical protein
VHEKDRALTKAERQRRKAAAGPTRGARKPADADAAAARGARRR